MNEWINQGAFMITNGMVAAVFIAGVAFLLLFWKHMELLGDYNTLMEQKQKRVENDYLKWVYYGKPMQIQRREKETRPSEVPEDSAREA